jgi:adenosylmethionine-8-amino-7-oxononanoate aminotransferase
LNPEEVLRVDANNILHDFCRQKSYSPWLFVDGQGSWLIDNKGQKYLDFVSGSFNINLGYQNKKLVESAKAQIERLTFAPYCNIPQSQLTLSLLKLLPQCYQKVIYSSGGTLAIETALKIAKQYTGKRKTISYWGAYHGSTMGALSCSGEPEIYSPYRPLVPGTIRLQPPEAQNSRDEKAFGGSEYLEPLQRLLDQNDKIAAIIFEPVQWGRVIIPPLNYWKGVEEICREKGVILIADEIVTGFGRIGSMFAFEKFNFTPDILVLGKGINSGYFPLAATIIRREISDFYEENNFPHGYTYQGHQVACAVANATLMHILDKKIVERVHKDGEKLLTRLKEISRKHKTLFNVRGAGFLVGIEIKTGNSIQQASDASRLFVAEAFKRRLILTSGAPRMVHVMPQLNIGWKDLDFALTTLDQVMTEIDKSIG